MLNQSGLPSAPKYATYYKDASIINPYNVAAQVAKEAGEEYRRTPGSLLLVANFLDNRPSGTRISPSSIDSTLNSFNTLSLNFFRSELRRGAAAGR